MEKLSAKIDALVQYYIKTITPSAPLWNIEYSIKNIRNKWNYMDGLMITALLKLFDLNGNLDILKFCDFFVSAFVTDEGRIHAYSSQSYMLDDMSPARNFFELYRLTGREKYIITAKRFFAHLKKYPRTNSGSFWYRGVYHGQVWLEGLFMAMPFYAECAGRFEDDSVEVINDIKVQFKNAEEVMRDSQTGLYYHGYDERRETLWADRKTGLSCSFWLRSNAMLLSALIDVCEILGDKSGFLRDIARNLALAFLKYQDESGMFYQIIDKKGLDGNYFESSGTAFFAYSALKGFRLGILPQKCREAGERAFRGIMEICVNDHLDINDKILSLGGICMSAELNGYASRIGSAEYYLREIVVSDDAKGIAPFLMAYSEMQLNK